MLDNLTYDKVKLLHQISCLVWFIEKHALPDAQAAGDTESQDMLIALHRDLAKNLERMHQNICSITQ